MTKEREIAIAQTIIEKMLNFVLLLVSALFLFVGIYALIDNRLVILNSEIPDGLKSSSMADREYPSIEELQKTNSEIVAWLTLDDTHVDYPVAKAKDNSKYLSKDYKEEYSLSGTPFVDFRNNFLNDNYTVIYGHRMNQKKMFGSLVDYADSSFMQKHRRGTITTKNGTYELEVLLYSVEDIYKTKIYDLVEVKNGRNQDLLKQLSQNAIAVNGKYSRIDLQSSETTKQWKLLLLSTCDKNSKRYRDILLLRIGDEV